MFNKPRGCVTARTDPRHKTVMDYFPEEKRNQLFPVGRLDKDTEGFLLITDDGKLSYEIMMPEHKVSKTYFFWAKGNLNHEKLLNLRGGAPIYHNSDVLTAPARIELLSDGTLGDIKDLISADELKIAHRRPQLPVFSGTVTITEGKKHEVKLMLKYVGCKIIYLKRLAIGNLILDPELSVGRYRAIDSDEIEKLKHNLV